MAVDADQVSSLLEMLPAVLQEDREAGEPDFLGRFLLGFESLLLGLGEADESKWGLEEKIAAIYRYFEPGAKLEPGELAAPPEFLQWLAGWVALTLREDWDVSRQRDLIAQAAQLYRLRGTRRGVQAFLEIYTRLGVTIEEFDFAFQLDVRSTVGKDTLLDGGAPFFFHVDLLLPKPSAEESKAQLPVAYAIVDLQKPAHTFYTLNVVTPTLQVNVHSTVGVDTLVG